MKKRYFVLRTLVLCLLVVPFILTRGPLRLEPYPAVILPGGGRPNKNLLASELKIHHELRLYMLMEDAKVEINHRQFLRPIPSYAKHIMRNDFGLGKGGKSTDSSAKTRRKE